MLFRSEIERFLQKRIETQPHVKTAGSCFLSIDKETPAWKLIDAAGLRGHTIGDIEISEKHANFFINKGSASFEDVKTLVETVRNAIPKELTVEMQLFEENGKLAY